MPLVQFTPIGPDIVGLYLVVLNVCGWFPVVGVSNAYYSACCCVLNIRSFCLLYVLLHIITSRLLVSGARVL